MLTLITIISKGSGPYWDMLRKQLAQEDIAPLTITHVPNLIGHPLLILLLICSGMFLLPRDPMFFLFWFGLIVVAAISSVFTILGLLKTKFFSTQVIGSLGFISSSIFANVFLGEHLGIIKIFCLVLAILGIVFFSWPKMTGKFFVFDSGIVFTILAVILGGISSILYKLATFHVSNMSSLLTGRFIGDLIGWTIIWLISMWFMKRNPISDFTHMFCRQSGQIFIWGIIITSLIGTWLVYKLPVTTLAIVGTIAFPVSYFISSFKYKERITLLMWLGTICILTSIVLFLFCK